MANRHTTEREEHNVPLQLCVMENAARMLNPFLPLVIGQRQFDCQFNEKLPLSTIGTEIVRNSAYAGLSRY